MQFFVLVKAAVVHPQQSVGIRELILVENRNVMVLARFAHGDHTIIAILRLPLLALGVVAKVRKTAQTDHARRAFWRLKALVAEVARGDPERTVGHSVVGACPCVVAQRLPVIGRG